MCSRVCLPFYFAELHFFFAFPVALLNAWKCFSAFSIFFLNCIFVQHCIIPILM